jgi:hypothetical protein
VNHCARLRAVAHGGQVLISNVTAELVRESPPAIPELSELGEYQLKDLQRPERIWQLTHPELQADFPPLASVTSRLENLPTQLSSFVGRDQAIVELRRRRLGVRLLTLTGGGGIGKTRLALTVAQAAVPDYADGVWFVELATLVDPGMVPQAVAAVLGVPEERGRALLGTLLASLEHRHALLLLDNCEHLVQPVAELAEALLRGCAVARVLPFSPPAASRSGPQVRRRGRCYPCPCQAHSTRGRRGRR